MPAARELAAIFETEVDLRPLKSLDSTLNSLKRSFNNTVAGFQTFLAFTAVRKLATGFEHLAQKAAKYQAMSDRTGLPVQEYQRFELAAELVGISAESAAGRIVYMSKTMGLALEGSKYQKKGFEDLGVSLRDAGGNVRSINDVMLDIAGSLEKYNSAQEKGAKLVHVFGRVAAAKLMPMLVHGRKGLEDLYNALDKTGGGVSQRFVQAMSAANQSLVLLGKAVEVAFTKATEKSALPWAKDKLDAMTRFVVLLGDAAQKTMAFKTAMEFVSALLTGLAIKWALLNWSILLTVGSLALLYLAYDSIRNFMAGNQSVFGDVIAKKFGAAGAAELKGHLREAADWANRTWEALKQYIPTTDEIKDGLGNVVTLFQFLWDVVNAVVFGIKQIDLVLTAVAAGVNLIVGIFGTIIGTVTYIGSLIWDFMMAPIIAVASALAGVYGLFLDILGVIGKANKAPKDAWSGFGDNMKDFAGGVGRMAGKGLLANVGGDSSLVKGINGSAAFAFGDNVEYKKLEKAWQTKSQDTTIDNPYQSAGQVVSPEARLAFMRQMQGMQSGFQGPNASRPVPTFSSAAITAPMSQEVKFEDKVNITIDVPYEDIKKGQSVNLQYTRNNDGFQLTNAANAGARIGK